MEILNVLLTSLLSVGALFAIAKIMGHKQVAQLDFFDYVCGITIGSIGAELATELEQPYKPLIALVIYGVVSLLLNLITHKIPRSRKYINGTPTVIFSCGTLYRENLRKAKLDLTEFLMLCREQGYFDLTEIQYAVFEYNGKLSILKSASSRPVSPSDLDLKVNQAEITTEVIMDGQILGENLLRMGRNQDWLEKKLKEAGYANACQIFLGIYRKENDTLSLYPNR